MADQLGMRKDGRFIAISMAPSLNKTPRGPSTPVVPYPVLFDLSNSEGTVSNVQFNGHPAYVLDQTTQSRCIGDEQGTAGGVRSGTVGGEIKPSAGSRSVRIGGKQIVRAGDPCTLNAGNCPGQYVAVPPPLSNGHADDNADEQRKM